VSGAKHHKGDHRQAFALVAPAMPRRLLNDDVALLQMDRLAFVELEAGEQIGKIVVTI
jgi:hypothetical protein